MNNGLKNVLKHRMMATIIADSLASKTDPDSLKIVGKVF